MQRDILDRDISEIQTLLSERLSIRGRTLEKQVARAGRLLPKRIRTEARFLVQAQGLIQNPKLARMIDATRAGRAHGLVVEYLRGIDPNERRKDLFLRTAALWSLYLFVIAGAGLFVARWRGLI